MKRWIIAGLFTTFAIYGTMFGLSAGTIVGGFQGATYEAKHWGILPPHCLPNRSYELTVRRFVDGKEVPVCVSKSRYDRADIGDWYLCGF